MTHPLTDADCKQIQEDIYHGHWEFVEDPEFLDDLIEELKKAMRPQESS